MRAQHGKTQLHMLLHWRTCRLALAHSTMKTKPRASTINPRQIEIQVDVSETPKLKEFAEKAKELIEKWHPKIAELLKSKIRHPTRLNSF